ncbi:MAG: choice-of-anchor D domain-containing protein [Candidatus Kapabacteria bacterium]|nr:choice-of-anchor D domain-containing protein [Candidatus Kapabacteria bacterium]
MKLSHNFRGIIMHHMRMNLVVALALVASVVTASAQSFNVYGVNTLAFPKITVDYVAFDATGTPITDLKASDFRLSETPQGGAPVDLTASVTHDCKDQQTDPEASIVIILDRSFSMDDIDPDGRKRFDYAKDAIKAFVNQIKFVGETRVSLVTFSGTIETTVEWASSGQPIIDSLKLMKVLTNTNYVLPFEDPSRNIYDLFKKRPANIPRYVFFLTDGHPNPGIDVVSSTKSESKFVDSNVKKMLSMGIRFYSVTIFEPTTHWTLEAMAKGTGGKSIVTQEKKLVDILSYLALETQIKKICRITWVSPYTCTEQGRSRTAQITMLRGNNPTANVPLVTPPTSVASVEISDPVLFCGDPAPNQASFANVTLTARGATFAATGQSIAPSTYFKVVDWNFPLNQTAFTPFNLPPGGTRTIRVQFTQGAAQTFRQAELSFTGFPCPPKVTLVGGTGVVLLQSPVGGETFSTCDSILIKWAGVLPTQPVNLEYSDDGGATWKSINPNATGLVYKWVAPRAGVNYKVRVSVSPTRQFAWATQLGGFGNETPTSVAVVPSGIKVLATGFFEGNTKFGNTTQAGAAGNIDGYFVELDSDGKIIDPSKVMLLVGTASNEEKVVGCVVDNKGNYYVGGYFSSPAVTFGPYSPTRGPLDTRNYFLFKFDSTGRLDWQAGSKGTNTQKSHALLTDVGLRYDVAGNVEVIAAGKFQRYIEVGIDRSGAIARSSAFPDNSDRDFYALYDSQGYPRFFQGTKPTTGTGLIYQSKTATDRLNFTYETGDYIGPKTFTPPDITIGNNSGPGSKDVYVTKNGAAPASSDVSKTVFAVKSPVLEFRPSNKITFASVPQGQTDSRTSQIVNTGNFDVTIKDVRIAGANAADFSLAGKLIGQLLAVGKTLAVEVVFTPTGTGARTALLEVIGSCGSPIQLSLEGVASAPCLVESIPLANQGKVPLSQPRQMKITCMLKNVGPLPINGNLTVITPDPDIALRNGGPFTVAPGACLDVDIDVKAATPGVKQIKLGYGLPLELCGDVQSSIKVEIVEPRVIIDTVDLGRIRLLTPTNGTIKVSNLNTEEAEIASITVVDPTNPNFAFTVPAPKKLAPGEIVNIPVVYTPQTRGAHTANVTVVIKGKESSPLIGLAKGFGFLPAIKAVGYKFAPWTISTTSPENGKVVITNTDSESPLRIESITFESAAPAGVFTPTIPGMPITIQPGAAPLEIPVTFTPQIVGNNSVRVRITHDAKTGPGAVPPYADTVVLVEGDGRDPSSLKPLTFAKTLTCATRTQTFDITNSSAQFDLSCQAPVGTGDVAAFTLDQTTGFVLKPGQTKTITVTFQPSAVGQVSATYTIPNDQSLKLSISMSGEGITTPVGFTFGSITEGKIGQSTNLPINVSYNSADFAGATPTSFSLSMTHDATVMKFKGLVAQQNGWTFVPTPSAGRLDVAATSATGALAQGLFVTPSFDVYLNADSALPVKLTVTTPLTCIVPVGSQSSVRMESVCFTNGRLVDFGAALPGLANPRGNPVRDVVTIPYSTGLTLSTSFQIVNALGTVVLEVHSPVVPSGEYVLEADVSGLSNGLYFIRMISGPFTATTSFNVIR